MTTKADLVAALKKSFDACDPLFDAVTDANALEGVAGRGGAMQPRAVALYGMIIHSNECYGATAVYMRLQKLTPPSSAGRGGGGGRGAGGGGGHQLVAASPEAVAIIPTRSWPGRLVRKIVEHARHTFHGGQFPRYPVEQFLRHPHHVRRHAIHRIDGSAALPESSRSSVPNGINTPGKPPDQGEVES